jgi:chaperone required for assembly of F1-ATPase
MLTRAKPDPLERPRRFWKEATAGDDGRLLLDGRNARTPAARPVVLPTRAAAELVAEEWAAQGELVDYARMPASRLAFTAIDRVAEETAAVADEAARYAASDLLCYFADQPQALVERERSAWEPWLAWAEGEFGVRFVRAVGVTHQAQATETIRAFRRAAGDLDPFRLTGVAFAGALFGSTVLAFAVLRGRLCGAEAFDLSRLDETFQNERWGVDDQAAERNAALKAEAVAVDRWFRALAA